MSMSKCEICGYWGQMHGREGGIWNQLQAEPRGPPGLGGAPAGSEAGIVHPQIPWKVTLPETALLFQEGWSAARFIVCHVPLLMEPLVSQENNRGSTFISVSLPS